jgi:hypothetical protein
VKEKTGMHVALVLPAARAARPTVLAPADRRRLAGILGFLAGLAAFGPVVGLAVAALAWLGARMIVDPR